ncbi:MAG TPA: YbdD/YjiX family protein [Steroidobacteraceae bacterium]|nr:YbdD/YjiX family protein [Steroidobacteraceae bacterium]
MLSRPILRALAKAVAAVIAWLRAVSGDDAYERYLTHQARAHEGPPLDRRTFYEEREQRKWSGVSRCC